MTKKLTRQHLHQKYYQIINPIHHLERTIERIDAENDRLQHRVFLLSMLSVTLTILGITLAIASFTAN